MLLLNYAIVTTRTHDPTPMIAAFDTLVNYLPEEAAQFFAEGMGQLDRVGYPAPVREVIEHYYLVWSTSTLH